MPFCRLGKWAVLSQCWIWFLQQCTTLCFKKMTNLRSAQSKTGLDVAKQRSHAKIYLFKRMYSNVRLLKLLLNLLGRQKNISFFNFQVRHFLHFRQKKKKSEKMTSIWRHVENQMISFFCKIFVPIKICTCQITFEQVYLCSGSLILKNLRLDSNIDSKSLN